MKHLKVALFFAVTAMFIIMVGCGGEEEEGEAAAITSTNPADGGELFANGELVINFDAAVKEVTVNGTAAEVAGTKATWKAQGLKPGAGVTLEIKWTDENDNTGSKTITVTVLEPDEEPPTITAIKAKKTGTDLDGATNLDPADLNNVDEGGILVTFSEPVTGAKFTLTEGDTALKWTAEFNKEKTEAVLTPAPGAGAELRHEGQYTLTIEGYKDAAGNAGEAKTIEFTMKGKEA